jgi:hypothetical protein
MRLINADELRDIYSGVPNGVYTTGHFITAIDECETVDAAPVKHGRWVENKYGYITCSNCNNFPLETMTGSLITMHYEPYESEYCPHCGAKMDLKEEPNGTDNP